jgi:NAD(P)-dependent dehydrogenase (short-subunit alcohol dehydrogenase family)
MKLENKIAIITGGSQGIGEAIAHAYAKEGATVVIANRNKKSGQTVADAINNSSGKAISYQCDITKQSDIKSLIASVIKKFGAIDILVNNAGIMINKPFNEYTIQDWDMMLDTNLKGSFMMSQAALSIMQQKKQGKIIFIASIAATLGFPNAAPYCASKGGLLSLAKSLAAEYAKEGININTISPGNTETPLNQHLRENPEFVKTIASMTPAGKAYLLPEDIAGAAVFLASDDAKAIYGANILVDNGWSIV